MCIRNFMIYRKTSQIMATISKILEYELRYKKDQHVISYYSMANQRTILKLRAWFPNYLWWQTFNWLSTSLPMTVCIQQRRMWYLFKYVRLQSGETMNLHWSQELPFPTFFTITLCFLCESLMAWYWQIPMAFQFLGTCPYTDVPCNVEAHISQKD